MKPRRQLTVLLVPWLCLLMAPSSLPLHGQSTPIRTAPLGIFQTQSDIGNPTTLGTASYQPHTQEYRIQGGGANMWFSRDEFHFLWRRIRGDFLVRTEARFLGEGVDPHRKLGWIARTDLSAGAAQVHAAVHGDGLTSLQFRRQPDANTEEVRPPLTGADVIQLERKGTTYILSVARFGQPFTSTIVSDLQLGEDLYVGLGVCSHNPDVLEEAVFRNVRIVIPPPPNFRPYRDYLGSNLEILDVVTGHRTVVHQTSDSLQAPNWTPDGLALIYNHNGLLYRFDLTSRTPAVINTGLANANNNDHVLSFDGRWLGLSHHSPDANGTSIIYIVPTEGGEPRRVTPNGPSYLHGWSPNGTHLLYTAQRNGDYDIYRISTDGGDETRLTSAPGLDDGSEYTPDGLHIIFNSVRTGHMQLWRMAPDGSNPEQLTNDEFNNWFPHVSPDGRWIAFLSFLPEVEPSDHPFYQQVYLRLIPTNGGPARVIAYAFGGQGTINVPSWAPDSRRLAFVSNTDLPFTDQLPPPPASASPQLRFKDSSPDTAR